MFCILLLVTYNVNCRLGEIELICLLSFTCNYVVIKLFLFGGASSSICCLVCAALYYCGTPRTFHIIMLKIVVSFVIVTRSVYVSDLCENRVLTPGQMRITRITNAYFFRHLF